MDGRIRTVLGDIDPAALGPTDYHEHLFHASPLLLGEDLDDEDASEREFTDFLGSGFAGIVDATPIGLGRNPAALARIAARTGGGIVAATGRHRDAHYPDPGWLDKRDGEAVFVRELTVGVAADDTQYATTDEPPLAVVDGRPVRAGIVKLGIDYWRITARERAALEAAAGAHRQTGAPLMVHTERASAALEILDLVGGQGVAASRVILAHVDRNPDPGLHAELAAAGAYLGYDGAARLKDWPESVVIDCLARLVEAGHADRVLFGGDVARRSSFRSYGGLPGLAYLGTRFVPRVGARLGEDIVRTILVDNPRRVLPWRRSEPSPAAPIPGVASTACRIM